MWCKFLLSFTFLILVCTVNGRPGDGTTQGTCNAGLLCQTDGTCTVPCTVNGRPGDGTARGYCNPGQFCQADGTCTGSMYNKHICDVL